MKHGLLLLAVAAAMLVSAPAFAQYVFIDVDGNGVCNSSDVLGAGTYDVDIYFNTNHNGDGSAATCDNGSNALTINSYEIVLAASGSGSLTFNKWTDLMSYATNLSGGTVGTGSGGSAGLLVGGNEAYIGLGSSVVSPAGLYKVGKLNVTVSGSALLTWKSNGTVSPVAETAFGTSCFGNDFDNTYKMLPSPPGGTGDFTDNCGTAQTTATVNKTWGQIKDLYK